MFLDDKLDGTYNQLHCTSLISIEYINMWESTMWSSWRIVAKQNKLIPRNLSTEPQKNSLFGCTVGLYTTCVFVIKYIIISQINMQIHQSCGAVDYAPTYYIYVLLA